MSAPTPRILSRRARYFGLDAIPVPDNEPTEGAGVAVEQARKVSRYLEREAANAAARACAYRHSADHAALAAFETAHRAFARALASMTGGEGDEE